MDITKPPNRGKDFVIDGSSVVFSQFDVHDAIAFYGSLFGNWHKTEGKEQTYFVISVPATVLSDENGVSVLGWEHLASVESHAQGCHMWTEGLDWSPLTTPFG